LTVAGWGCGRGRSRAGGIVERVRLIPDEPPSCGIDFQQTVDRLLWKEITAWHATSEYALITLFAGAENTLRLFHHDKWNASTENDRAVQIKNELVQLYNEQTEFYRKGGRLKQTNSEIAEFEKRRERVRALFAELEQVRNVDRRLLEPDEPILPNRVPIM